MRLIQTRDLLLENKSLLNRRTLSVLLLGFSSGLPLALTGSTLQAWFATQNISIVAIGWLSLVGQPYLYKVLWAPLLDRFSPPFLGKRRGWIMLMQCALAIALVFMAFGDPKQYGAILAILALVVAFLSATQDIAIDAYRTDLLTPTERGLGAAFLIMGYRIAMMTSGGIALIMADHMGWRSTYLIMAGIMLLTIGFTWLSPRTKEIANPISLKKTITTVWRQITEHPLIKQVVLFLLFYKLGDALTVSLSSVFLLKTLHFSLSIVGTVNKIVGIGASIIGGVIGGILLSRLSIFRALLWFGTAQAFATLFYVWLAMIGKNMMVFILAIFSENFFSGMSAAALIAFITGLCDKRFSATQFALFSVISSISRVFIGPIAGEIAHHFGWITFFWIAFFASFPGIGLLWALRNSYDSLLDQKSI